MDSHIALLTERIHVLEGEIELEWARRAAELRLTFDGKRARFESDVLARHRAMKTALLRYLADARPLVVLTAPVVYALIVLLALLDSFVTLYQAICFPVYGIAKVRRRDYLVLDRARLAYINAVEKLNCAYCSYANGILGYAREVGAPPLAHRHLLHKRAGAVVGARNASLNGRKLAGMLARGIDAAAHEGSLATGTAAVVAGGINVVCPAEQPGFV